MNEKASSDEERSKFLKLFATITEQVEKENEEKNSSKQKSEVKTETDFSSLKENIPNGQLSDNQSEQQKQQNNSQTVKTKQDKNRNQKLWANCLVSESDEMTKIILVSGKRLEVLGAIS